MQANAKHLRLSPKKANVIAYLVRGRNAQEASNLLNAVNKKGADLFKKVIDSAIANAKNNDGVDNVENLVISSIYVTKASTLRRGVPASRGRIAPIKKRNCHVFVELSAPTQADKKPKTNKTKKNTEENIKKKEKTPEKSKKSKTTEPKTATKKPVA